jgi:hypothetical protein
LNDAGHLAPSQQNSSPVKNNTPSPEFFINILSKKVKAVCFDILLQVLILSNLLCLKIVQEFMALLPKKKREWQPHRRRDPQKEKATDGLPQPTILPSGTIILR